MDTASTQGVLATASTTRHDEARIAAMAATTACYALALMYCV